MNDNRKIKEQLIQELEDLRRRIAELEKSETERKRAEEALRESEQRLNNILHGSPIPAFVITKDHKVMYWNKALEEMSGIKSEELIGTNEHWKAFYSEKRPCMADLLVGGEIEVTPQWFEGKYAKSKLIEGAYEATDFFPALGEGGRWLGLTAAIIRSSKGELIGVLETLEDITERKQMESKLMESEERYRTAIEHSNDGVALVREGRHVYVNQKFLETFGYDTMEEAIGKRLSITVHPDDLEMVAERNRARESGEPVPLRYEFKGIRKDGIPIYIEISATRVTSQGESVTLAYFRDVTERKRLEEKLRTMSIIDDLTGLYNRRGFLTLAEQQMKLTERTKKDMLLFFADLDKMKQINDTLGHQEGDKALVEIATTLKKVFRESDIIGRMGGDEFAILAIDTSNETREVLMKRLHNYLDDYNRPEGRSYTLSLSIGIAPYDPKKPFSLDELMAQADTLMYEEKRNKLH